jgi:sarcosine oxidase subunit beta
VTRSGPDVVVVGAGAIGLAAAGRAVELGSAVTVLERDHPASGSSGLSAGIFNRQAVEPLDVEVRVEAERFLSRLERDHDLPLQREGYIRAAHDDAQLARLASALDLERALGVDDARLLDRAGLRQVVPDMAVDDLAGGLFGPSDGHLDGHLLCATLAARARAAGARVLVGTALVGARRTSGGRHRLRTSAGDIEADVVVNAAGAWAPAVGDLLGAGVRLVSQRHQIVQVRLPRPLPYTMPTVNEYVPGSGDYALYFRAEGPDQLIAGLHTHEVLDDHPGEDPDGFDRGVDADYVDLVGERLTARLPGLGDLGYAGGWAGLYPISPDGLPQVGPHPAELTVVSACGGGGVGLTNGLVYGRLAAEWAVLGEARSLPAARAYLPDRPSLAPVAG